MKKIVLFTVLFLVSISPISAQDFFDDFESYYYEEQLVVQNPDDWTTWNNTPGSTEDPYIANQNGKAVNITGINDLVYATPDYTIGVFEIIFDIYIPDGGDGYFNTLQAFPPGADEWGMQVYFGHTNYGEGNIDGGGALAALFTFDYDTWMNVKVVVDLDSDWGEFYLDNELIHGWIWSQGAFGTSTTLALGGNNFYAWDGGVFAHPHFFIDNYEFDDTGFNSSVIPQNVTAELSSNNDVKVDWDPPEGYAEELFGYNVYKNDEFMSFIEDPETEYFEYGLEPGAFEYCVSAIYNWGESMQVCADEIYIIDPTPPAPTNLTGPDCYNLGDTIYLIWDYIGMGEWINWDAGVNTDNGIGLTNGGSFSVASHWFPEDLLPYNGCQLLEISFYANGDPNAIYVIKVWTGANGTNEVLSQEVTSFIVDDWNTIVLNTPYTINAVEHLWFGYDVTHEAGTQPAGCDDGPAIAFKGDMITTGGGWVSMSVEYGLDFNWNLAGFVGLANETKDFSHFNMYVKHPGSTFFTVIEAVSNPFSFVPDEPGEYQFYVTAVWDEGESYPSNIYSVDLCTGVLNTTAKSIELYPNPVSDIIFIESDFEIISLKVFNPTGQIIVEEVVNNNNYNVDVSQLNPGIYFLQIEFEDETILEKIIVE